MTVRTSVITGVVVSVVLALMGCKHEKPNFIYMPDMTYTSAVRAQEEGSLRLPPEGTVPRNTPSQFVNVSTKNPLARDLKNLKRGQTMYNTYCIVCHGAKGLGDGLVGTRFSAEMPKPTALVTDKIQGWTDAEIYLVLSHGRNTMNSYASQIQPKDRWAIAHYLRALYRAQNPTEKDLEKAKDW